MSLTLTKSRCPRKNDFPQLLSINTRALAMAGVARWGDPPWGWGGICRWRGPEFYSQEARPSSAAPSRQIPDKANSS